MNRFAFTDLTIGYDKKRVASNLTLAAPAGACIALIGLNGSGKSTLMRTLSGLQPALNGSILWNEKPLASYTTEQQAQFRSLVLTEKVISTQFRVEEFVQLGRMPYRSLQTETNATALAQVKWAMEDTGIVDLANRYLHQLSDGQLQRVQIARALAQDTDVLFLDEPFAHLDITHRAQIWQLLYDLTRKHEKTVLFSLHDLDFGWEVPTAYWLLHQGNLNSYSPEELQNQNVLNEVYANSNLQFDPKQRAFVLSLNR